MPMTDMQKLMMLMAGQQFGGLLQQGAGMQPQQQMNPMAMMQFQQDSAQRKKQEEAREQLTSFLGGGPTGQMVSVTPDQARFPGPHAAPQPPTTEERSFPPGDLTSAHGMSLLNRAGYGDLPIKAKIAQQFGQPEGVGASDLVKVPDGAGGYKWELASKAVGQPGYVKSDTLSPERFQQNLDLRRAGKPETTFINNPAATKSQTAFAKKVGETQGEAFASLQTSADTAATVLPQLDRMEINLANIDTGSATGLQTAAGAWMQALGLDPEMVGTNLAEISSVQDFNSAKNRMTLEYTSLLKGAISEKEISFIDGIPPSIYNLPEGNTFIIDALRRANTAVIARADAAAAFVEARERGGESVSGAQYAQFLRNYDKQNPVFTEDDREQLRKLRERAKGDPLSAAEAEELRSLRQRFYNRGY